MPWSSYLLILIIIVTVISIILYFFQERLLFHPEKLPADFQFQYENQEVGWWQPCYGIEIDKIERQMNWDDISKLADSMREMMKVMSKRKE